MGLWDTPCVWEKVLCHDRRCYLKAQGKQKVWMASFSTYCHSNNKTENKRSGINAAPLLFVWPQAPFQMMDLHLPVRDWTIQAMVLSPCHFCLQQVQLVFESQTSLWKSTASTKIVVQAILFKRRYDLLYHRIIARREKRDKITETYLHVNLAILILLYHSV